MRDKIFLSYRRQDASAEARSIYQRLRSTFGKEQLFIDVDTIERGRDFRTILDQNLSSCKVLIAVIGQRWLTALDNNGARRLDSEGDFVRLEISRALQKNIIVIPVLVDNATLPKAQDLPDDLRALTFRQAAIVRHESFPQDMDALERDIRRTVGIQRRWPWVAGIAALCALVSLVTYPHWFPLAEKTIQRVVQSFTNSPRERDIASVMTRCVKDAPHPEKAEIIRRLAEQLAGAYQFGWIAEADEEMKPGEQVWKAVKKIEASGDELKIAYDWRNGQLRLVPVVQQKYSTRSAVRVATVLQGTWSQGNGYGCIEMKFDDTGNAQARWGVATSDTYDAPAFLQKNSATY